MIDEPLDIELPPEQLDEQVKEYDEQNKSVQAPTHERPLPAATGAASILPDSVRRVRRSNTASSIASTSSAISMQTKIKPLPKATYSNASLHVLHDNLNTRLRLFFSQKLVNRRIRVSVFLLPLPGEEETCIAKGTLMTELGGVFKSSICVPWPGQEPHGRKLRVRTELLHGTHEHEHTIDDQNGLNRALSRFDEAVVSVSHSHAPLRVISDIDDTIKMTHVLGGMKTVMRNVFTRPHEELTCEGMKEWYWDMYNKGASFHFVSNSPFELFGVLREYLAVSGFPPGARRSHLPSKEGMLNKQTGSMRLKEYGGSSGSLLGGLWEPAGARKRGGLEEILKVSNLVIPAFPVAHLLNQTFADSRFILVGDSGEQDLEVYASLAAQYPNQIVGIFIRDVTTPQRRNSQINSAASSIAGSRPSSRAGSRTVSRQPSIEALSLADDKKQLPPLPARPFAVRRPSDAKQAELLIDLALEDAQHDRSDGSIDSSRTLKPLVTSPEPMPEDEVEDLLSPNNPLRRNSEDSASLAPLDAQGYTEVERRVVNLFLDRVKRAKAVAPPHIFLKIFRDGMECRADASRVIDECIKGSES